MNIAHFEPWSFVDRLNRDLNIVTDRTPGKRWVPAVDIIEEQDRFLLRADVPGVSPADIDVSMDSGVLSVAGERHAEERKEDSGAQRIERTTGRFLRRFTLPETADAEGISAKTHDGILEVTIPKLAEIQPRRIAVEAA
jgi:HSP20 family protein